MPRTQQGRRAFGTFAGASKGVVFRRPLPPKAGNVTSAIRNLKLDLARDVLREQAGALQELAKR